MMEVESKVMHTKHAGIRVVLLLVVVVVVLLLVVVVVGVCMCGNVEHTNRCLRWDSIMWRYQNPCTHSGARYDR